MSTLSNTSRGYTPEPGSLTERILQLLVRNPDETYSERDLQLKFDVSERAAVGRALEVPCSRGLVQKIGFASRPDYKAGAPLADWWVARTPALASAAATPAKQPEKAPRPRGGPPDLSQIKVLDIPLPEPMLGRPGAGSVYAAIFEKMSVGQMVPLSERHAHSFITWAKKNRPGEIATRKLAEPIEGLPMGVWRIAKPSEAADAASKPAAKAAQRSKV